MRRWLPGGLPLKQKTGLLPSSHTSESPYLDRTQYAPAEGVRRALIFWPTLRGEAGSYLIASGSEVHLVPKQGRSSLSKRLTPALFPCRVGDSLMLSPGSIATVSCRRDYPSVLPWRLPCPKAGAGMSRSGGRHRDRPVRSFGPRSGS